MGRFLFVLLLLGLYWLYGWRPFLVHGELVIDDFLYVRHAHGILDWLQGRSPQWLGPYDCFCLAKAPFYGMWLAFLNILGIPLRVGDFLLLLTCPFLFARAVRPMTKLVGWRFVAVVVVLVANPLLPGDFRPHREGVQVSLTNLCLISAVGMVLRWEKPLWQRLRWALMAGFFLGLCYLNREEAIWLVAALSVAAGIMVLTSLVLWRQGHRPLLSLLGSQGIVLCVLGLAFLQPVLTVCALNKKHYGAFMTTFRRSSALTQLIQRLTSLEPEGHQPYVPIARATRMKAYELSPTFAQLKPSLEEEGGFWSANNRAHSVAIGRSPTDRDLVDSIVEFSFAHAADQAGAKSPKQMEDMFLAIDRELGDAVRAGKIQAGAHGPSILTAPRPGDRRRILAEWWTSFSTLLRVVHVPYYWPDTVIASQAQLDDLQRLTSSSVVLYPKPNLQFTMRAWAVDGINAAQRIAYPVLFLTWFGLLAMRRNEVFTLAPSPRGFLLWSVAIPLSGLATFCLGMAVLQVLSFRFLYFGSYNHMGFGPLSVLCALVIAGSTIGSSPGGQASCGPRCAGFTIQSS